MPQEDSDLRRLLDKEAIREALIKYTRGMDRHDDTIMAEAYHAGAREDHVDFIGDAQTFIHHARSGHERFFDAHHHYMANQSIDLDGDVAHVETYFLAALRHKDGQVDMVGGRYVDLMERRNDRWAIVKRACIVEWQGELAKAQHAFPPDLPLRGQQGREDLSYHRPLELSRPDRRPV